MDREDKRSVDVPVIRIHQPIGDFYIGCMNSKALRSVCWFDIRRLQRIPGSGLDDFLGIQREVSPKRVSEIKEYVRNIDATFPTGVIIAVDEKCASLKQMAECGSDKFGILTLSNYPEPEDEADRILYAEISHH